VCTFPNNDGVKFCQMCQTPLNKQKDHDNEKTNIKITTYFPHCPECTFHNNDGDNICQICKTPLKQNYTQTLIENNDTDL